MGLCKCPKRTVTNQFCFEHRVNVCEHCMVINHPKCIVQSYLQWLKDSDYDSSCALCQQRLDDGECVRLSCYHVFHWDCLNGRALALPANTAPSGHRCPQCSDPVFPAGNLKSPVADALRSRLAQVNWGRSELGLPLLAGEPTAAAAAAATAAPNNAARRPPTDAAPSQPAAAPNVVAGIGHKSAGDGASGASASGSSAVVLNMDSYGALSEPASRRPARAQPIGAADNDDNKYNKSSFRRWTRRFNAPSSRPPWRRTWFVFGFGATLFCVIVLLMLLFGRDGPSYGDELIQSHM